RVEEDALQAAEEMRAQAEQDARTVLEEARDATDMIWQEAERERLGVEAETIRLETLRHRSLEQLGRVYGHLESVLDEVRIGIGRVEEEQEDLEEATVAAAARLGVEPPASSPEESPRFPDPRDRDGSDGGEGMLAATRPDTPTEESAPLTSEEASGGSAPSDRPQQPVLPDTDDAAAGRPADGSAEATQPVEAAQPAPADSTAEITNPDGGSSDQEATQRLEPVGNKPGAAKANGKEGKPQA
ncbi:MAG: hypothetical protein K0S88_3615, partial [Actinomycetia bacterium]|nr:hypothetical protein [Actinomycetes bacterium]